jgi:RHS repeat-associated protein
MDDPATTGVTEGFGLMLYNARWYDPVLGRFAQADTIVPGGVQGLDRYAYVNNSPINYIDPSGHCIVEEDKCETSQGNNPNASGGPSPLLTPGGAEIEKIYQRFRDTCGWWNENCKSEFTYEQFIGLYILYESNIDVPKSRIDELTVALATITAQNLYVGGFNPPYCSVGGQCANAVFNFIGANIDGNSGLWGGPEAAVGYAINTGVPKFGSEAELRDEISSVGQTATNPSTVITLDQNEGPSSWGNDYDNWKKALITHEIWEGFNGLSPNSIYYYYKNALYFSVDQYNCWINKIC